ncbi:polysaccharide deacetylase family protein [Methylobacterium brachythecii]|uniref:Chitooligosaccharide deacetylase n=1 Tax=Methylobacterium brachythecii TaxID=1176177 RepID=A0A7W6AJJ9_9HYPH|nr:polysaccharide deacetylase family protein [Methylobacterium brachythecii]MBB3904572.1 peptidoglycan/xylan/chitin deacetylase (PgdA/CDA1 family) [Methylobacterium brachythecii]
MTHRLARHIRTSPVELAPATPLVSFTFDDVPVCAATTGAQMLEAHSARGTFYISGGLIGTQARHWRVADADHITALHTAGHEIGSHTYSHIFVPNLRSESIVAESQRNAECLRAVVPGLTLESFAFPFGFGSLPAKKTLASIYRTSRGIGPGLNVGRADLQLLKANPLMDGRLDAAGITRLMDEALEKKGWLVFYGHDVVENPSPYGCSPGLLETALRAAGDRDIACVPVAEALRRAL